MTSKCTNKLAFASYVPISNVRHATFQLPRYINSTKDLLNNEKHICTGRNLSPGPSSGNAAAQPRLYNIYVYISRLFLL